jgi:hypothetical protein
MPKIADIVGRPQVHFDDPVALAREPALSKDEKLVALASWERDAEALEIAADEGMGAAPHEEHEPVREKIEAASAIVQQAEKPVPPIQDTKIDPDRHVSIAEKPDRSAG